MRFALSVLVFASLIPVSASAQSTPEEPHWIWFDEGNPQESAPAGKVWFRREVRGNEPSTGAVRIACDDHFVLWVNGKKIGEGGADKPYRFNLNGIVERGPNVICVEAENKSGPAGLYVDGEVRGQGGKAVSFDSGRDWSATKAPPKGDAWLQPKFVETGWLAVKDLGPHAQSHWRDLQLAGSYLDRYDVAPGFELTRIAEPELVGSLVSMTWGNRGKLLVSRERGPILALSDADGDGKYDQAAEFSTEVTNCQGLCQVGDDLFVVGVGPSGTGVYRLPDANHDDKADSVELLTKPKGDISEHGPHDVILGPDGWLYHNLGNHAWIQDEPQPESPARIYEEGDLLQPRYEDARGHAIGIKAPGGTIWRLAPDGKKAWLETNGFRNHYDIAFNSAGDLFTFDSDMEWDVGAAWYRPVRVNHCTPGSEFGWRSGAACWPAYYFDSLPGTVDVGRGSPCGVVFYEHTAFPEKYRGAMLLCDWSMGRILAAVMHREGATYAGTFETLVTGNPLNTSDIEVDRDGSIVFCTGGRNTEGGVYRITHSSAEKRDLPAATIADALALPQMTSGWARELAGQVKAAVGDQWEPGLIDVAKTGKPADSIRALTLLSQLGPKPSADLLIELASHDSRDVRQFAVWLLGDHPGEKTVAALASKLADADKTVQRRGCEAFVRSGSEAPVEPLVKLLGADDRWLRFAARLALERVPADKWREVVLKSPNPTVATLGLLALHRVARDSFPAAAALEAELDLLKKPGLTVQQQLDLVRMVQLTLTTTDKPGEAGEQIGIVLRNRFPAGLRARAPVEERTLSAETARLLAWLQVPGAAPLLVEALETAPTQALQTHYALVVRYLNVGWDPDLKRRLLDWYNGTSAWEGGHSLIPYLANIVSGSLERYTPEDRRHFLEEWRKRTFAAQLILARSEPAQIQDFDRLVSGMLKELEQQPSEGQLAALANLAVEALGRSDAAESQALLRKLFDEFPDRRDPLARSLAAHPSVENFDYYLRTIRSGEGATLQQTLQALKKVDKKPEQPEPFRLVIQAGLKLGENGGLLAAALLEHWTASPHNAGKDPKAALAHYQAWYTEKFPDAAAPELPAADLETTKFSVEQLVGFLDNDPAGKQGNAERGKAVFAKANCIKCHRFLKDGEGVGPDLTTLRRRFQRKEIVESLVNPSQVISDQYKSVTVVTVDGLIYTGMPLPPAGKNDVLPLLLSDATKVEVVKANIEEQRQATVSVMPLGVLKDLTLPEIADLFAFLETSKSNPEPAK